MSKRKDLRSKPRWWQAVKAFIGGHYWGPCYLCMESFGRGEKGSGSLYMGGGRGKSVCANCAKRAETLTEEGQELEDREYIQQTGHSLGYMHSRAYEERWHGKKSADEKYPL